MISLLNIICLGLLLFCIVLVQATPSVEASNDANKKTPLSSTNDQLYELYKIIREDPRYALISNKDIVAYIYRNFVLGNGNDMNSVKPKYQKRPRYRQQKQQQTE
ncbi:hypothetical protein I4U23_030706 [Adineta vaga]|nr:hypothetical protein I4U23_030706 [Adineta vaga]